MPGKLSTRSSLVMPVSGRWAGSNRRSRLPVNWPSIRADVLDEEPFCRLCGIGPSVVCDHIIRGDDHSRANLQGICRPCDRIKSAREGGTAPHKRRSRLRPAEPHPGYRS